MRDLAMFPKAHLLLRLEGAMRPATLEELAAAAGVAVPAVSGFGGDGAHADRFVLACGVLRTEADLRRLVDEVVADAAAAGAVWVEPAVHLPRHRDRLGPDERIIEILLDELSQAAARHHIGAGLLVAADRALDPAAAVDQARLAIRYAAEGVVSFGLRADGAGRPPEPFAEAFDIALAGGLLSAPHAGEAEGPPGVAGAVTALGAHRIEHGVRVADDPDLVIELAELGVCLDVCPSADLRRSRYPSPAEHPLPDLLAAGVACSVNADAPLLFGPGLLEEYGSCRTDLGLDDATLATVATTSVEASRAPDHLKVLATADIGAWLTRADPAAPADAVA